MDPVLKINTFHSSLDLSRGGNARLGPGWINKVYLPRQTKAKNKFFIVLKCPGQELQQFKVDPVLKINTFHNSLDLSRGGNARLGPGWINKENLSR